MTSPSQPKRGESRRSEGTQRISSKMANPVEDIAKPQTIDTGVRAASAGTNAEEAGLHNNRPSRDTHTANIGNATEKADPVVRQVTIDAREASAGDKAEEANLYHQQQTPCDSGTASAGNKAEEADPGAQLHNTNGVPKHRCGIQKDSTSEGKQTGAHPTVTFALNEDSVKNDGGEFATRLEDHELEKYTRVWNILEGRARTSPELLHSMQEPTDDLEKQVDHTDAIRKIHMDTRLQVEISKEECGKLISLGHQLQMDLDNSANGELGSLLSSDRRRTEMCHAENT